MTTRPEHHPDHPDRSEHLDPSATAKNERLVHNRRHAAALLSLLTGYGEDMSDEDAWTYIPEHLRDVQLHHPGHNRCPLCGETMTRAESDTTDAPTRALCPACKQIHADPNYERGCVYATHVTHAITAALDDDQERARHDLDAADRTLWPLGNIDDPNALRDFIAATHTRLETHLRQIGATVHS